MYTHRFLARNVTETKACSSRSSTTPTSQLGLLSDSEDCIVPFCDFQLESETKLSRIDQAPLSRGLLLLLHKHMWSRSKFFVEARWWIIASLVFDMSVRS